MLNDRLHIFRQQYQQQMSKAINKITNDKQANNPIQLSNDLYIIQYRDKNNRIKHTNTIQQIQHNQNNPQSSQQNRVKQKEINHRQNIDRLMKMLTDKSKEKEADGSACSKIFKLVEKLYNRHWKIRLLHLKTLAFEKIKTHSKKQAEQSNTKIENRLYELKDSLQMKQNQIERGSKHFELNDLINIVTLHEEEKIKNKKQASASPKKVSHNVYILRKNNSKEQISIQTKISSNTNIKSDQLLPTSTRTARSISPNSIDKSPPKDITFKDSQINLPNHLQGDCNENKLFQLSIDSILMNKAQQPEKVQNFQEITNIKLPSFGLANKDIQSMSKRTNRLMDTSPKKIIFHYRNSKDKSPSPIRNQYHIPQNLNLVQTNLQKNIRAKQQAQQKFTAQQPTRFQRISSLQIINPKTYTHHNLNNQSKKQEDTTKDRADSIQTKRCLSMPKITFTYTSRPQIFVNPKPIDNNFMKNSPILVLNQLKASNPNNINSNPKQDSHLSKQIKINTMNQQVRVDNFPVSRITPKIHKINSPSIENNYNIPVNNFILGNPSSPRPQRTRIISNYPTQTLPSTSFHSNNPKQIIKRNDYYGLDDDKQKIGTQQTLPSPIKERARSTDTYVMIRPKQHLQHFQKIVVNNIINADMQRERERARSCNIKMEVISKKQPLIKAY